MTTSWIALGAAVAALIISGVLVSAFSHPASATNSLSSTGAGTSTLGADYRAQFEALTRTQTPAQAATINRRLAAPRAFCRWAKGAGLVTDLPTDEVRVARRTGFASNDLLFSSPFDHLGSPLPGGPLRTSSNANSQIPPSPL